jgi:hypothetical protein
MWQPNRSQWIVICLTAALLVLAWPPDRGHGSSLGMKAARWVVDPSNVLPALPPPLPPGVGDDGDAVAAHDALESEYFRLYNSSAWTRRRLAIKAGADPFDPTSERQWLVAIAVVAALLTWRLGRVTF